MKCFYQHSISRSYNRSLQSKIIEIRTNKIKERLKFSKEQYEIKQAEFDLLQKQLENLKILIRIFPQHVLCQNYKN